MNPPRIVLTGGPGGGKTTFQRDLRRVDPDRERYILVPEAATLLIGAGHLPGTKEFQLAVVRLQLALEQTCSNLARPGQVQVCDRSTVDSLAYWFLLGGSEKEFFDRIGLSKEAIYGRYDGALHLRTAALGAEKRYVRLQEGARMETSEEAAEIDALCAQVWSPHPGYRLVENVGEKWEAKSRQAKKTLDRLIDSLLPPA